MNEETVEISPATQERLDAALKEAYKEHEKEKRRSLEISSSFFEKLSALDAGSIAVAASIGIAMIAKPELQSPSLHANAHWLVIVIILLWLSLAGAVIHNLVAVWIAKLESLYSGDEFVKTILRKSMAAVVSEMTNRLTAEDHAQIARVESFALEGHNLQQGKKAKRIRFLYPCATTLGHISIGAFLLAYTFIMARAVCLWWATR